VSEQLKNRASPEEAASFVDKFEEFEAKVLESKMAHLERCRKIRQEQKELLDDAKSQGVAKQVVRNVVKARELERKAKALEEDLEDDNREMFIDIRKALGDFADSPLGAAAVDREGQQDERTAGIVETVKNSLSDDDWEKARPPQDEAAE
jgi:uncharacterized protein (UPF0335 family)